MTPIYPQAIRQGDTIAFVAPAGVPEMERVERARDRLEALGYHIKLYGDLSRRRGYLAGDDQSRADELMAAFADPKCSAVFPVRGGYGCLRLLDLLDFGLIRDNPKVFVGFSDNTVLHAAFWKQCRLVTLHGPHPSDGIGHPEGWPPTTERAFWQALRGDVATQPSTMGSIEVDQTRLRSIVSGVAEGRLAGGNLSLVCSLLGTPYEIDAEGCILLLEDVGEPPYRIDRMLAQLTHAGVFERVAGVLLGHFTNCVAAEPQRSLSLLNVLTDYFSGLHVPVLAGFPCGHERENITLPLGVTCMLDCDSPGLTVKEPAVRT